MARLNQVLKIGWDIVRLRFVLSEMGWNAAGGL
jgi:hypothetical protein